MNATAWQAQSLLLDYPAPALPERMPLLREVARGLPEPVGAPLVSFLDHCAATPLSILAEDYVATFDHRKLGSLYLTYYSYGDTRKRGMALLRFTHAYRAAGLELAESELPDHLAVVLEFAAGAPEAGTRLLTEHRAGLELLRLGLRETGSPWAPVLDSVSATLPPLRGRDHDAVARLVAQGPPEEEVGLEPFGGVV
ncbi:nitrate reductase molybdenum cofactor assembly chaperone [Amycolatopsis alkalitolerans]|uniref:Nitrate reductase molybdenum cofactor assembly chaperone n=1 Tax=Amycolatopsis alkalitolerans TaxID=2547244 RepID=A0A5C4LSG2_9PSEU|nr:nitrate reductase molybdenum cofactor assembly chaperone [Amycolatopsis alkalitolerans]TNC20485.1 nitrate reductase molybdenum cofactor assembly chaperone [Amycolatopsis alkalitolerans]